MKLESLAVNGSRIGQSSTLTQVCGYCHPMSRIVQYFETLQLIGTPGYYLQTYIKQNVSFRRTTCLFHQQQFNPLKPELNPICYLLALLAHHFLHVSRIRVKSLTIRLLMSYIYGAPILDVSRSHTTTQHSR